MAKPSTNATNKIQNKASIGKEIHFGTDAFGLNAPNGIPMTSLVVSLSGGMARRPFLSMIRI